MDREEKSSVFEQGLQPCPYLREVNSSFFLTLFFYCNTM
jgi:hypothetical protein